MKNTFFLLLVIIIGTTTACHQNDTPERNDISGSDSTSIDSIYQKDFAEYWSIIEESFAYFDTRKTDWDKVKEIYQPIVDTITTRGSFVQLLESCNRELYNNHVHLSTNLSSSFKLVPSHTDIWGEKIGEKVIIAGVREAYNADKVGLKVGMEIRKINGIPILEAIQPFLPKSFRDYDAEVYDYVINLVLAGTHDTPRKITIKEGDKEADFYPDKLESKWKQKQDKLLDSKILDNNIGYIKINNSLDENDLVKDFHRALDDLMSTKGLILDLRGTPSGGENTIAKGIMGRFISKELPYQRYRYVLDEKELGIPQIWEELVVPLGKQYDKPLVVLANYWTGSMGEGIAIGFDGMKRATIIGTKMARLIGGMWSYDLKETGIGFSIPGIKIYHIDKSPREDFMPKIILKDPNDCMKKAIEIIEKNPHL